MIISLMGNNGSEDKTISRRNYKSCTDLVFETIYKHQHQYAPLKLLFKLIGKEKKDKLQNKTLYEEKRPVGYALWSISVWSDRLKQRLYYRIFKTGYLYDQYFDLKYLDIPTRFANGWISFSKVEIYMEIRKRLTTTLDLR
jgi:hypothetical protein